MQLSLDQSTFLEMIKTTCIQEATKNKILPSIIASLGIVISNWGTTKEFYNTRNIYLLPVNDWNSRCYSKLSEAFYDTKEECNENGAILYRVYGDHKESIIDFISYLVNTKRSVDGPLKYNNILQEENYKEAIDKLIRSGFIEDYLHMNLDINYINSLVNIIERYHLYEWDTQLKEELEMSKKKRHQKEEQPIEEPAPIIEQTIEHMYRVRLDWNKCDTQIFASPSYDDALEVALKHEGYKIYIDDDGELFEDPWIKKLEIVEEQEIDNGPKPIRHIMPGKPVVLNNTPVYRGVHDKRPMGRLTGQFFFYDGTVINNRGKITTHKHIEKKDPKLITGYIDLS